MTKYEHRLWRVGRSQGQHIYAQLGNEPSKDDVEIAVCTGETTAARAVAARIVRDHNATVRR